MELRPKSLLAAAGGLLALWVGWGVYVDRTTEEVPHESLDRFDGVELRRYPRTVLVETTAPDRGTAFRRLFRYIGGANAASEAVATTAPGERRGEEIEMTAPVRTGGASVSMTAPVRTDPDAGDGQVTMAFYLPADYGPETAPVPTDPAVRLVVEPPRTVAVRRFRWYATADRVDAERRRLLDALAARGFEATGEVSVLQYDDPWTPPVMRRNEVVVDVAAETT